MTLTDAEKSALLWLEAGEGQPTLDRQVWIGLEERGLVTVSGRGRASATPAGIAALRRS